MKVYKVVATGTEFLKELKIEAKSEEDAEEIYRNKWSDGLIHSTYYELEIVAERRK
jgi:hypothetical protein